MRTKLYLTFVLAMAMVFMFATGVMAAANDCGTPQVCTLWAGKNIDVGTITVWNDDTNLYVKYETKDDWYLTEVHLYVGTGTPPGERLPPGHAPYKAVDLNTKSYLFTIPLDGLGFNVVCDETILWLQAHAAVNKIVDGAVVQEETAYGSCNGVVDPGPGQGAWYANMSYTVQCCEGVEPCYEFKGETAWAAGTRYVTRGNWATYTPYGANNTVTLWAGQTINVGTVKFSAVVGGKVTITIILKGTWIFAPVSENVKIQDYATAPPAVNPAPGLFKWKFDATGNSFTGEVPANNFYGVHVNVGYWQEVPCL